MSHFDPLSAAAPAADGTGGSGGEAAGDRGQPLYLQIADSLQARIANGTYPVGKMLATETELCREFGVSRYTVREALRRLTDFGLVQRRAGAGTVVIADRPPTAYVHRVETLRALLKYPPNTYRDRVSFGPVTANRELAQLISCDVGNEWFKLTYIRRTLDSETPIALGDFYILPRIAERLDPAVVDKTTVYEHIEREAGYAISQTEISIFATALKPAEAQMLDVAAGAPALTIVRRYLAPTGQCFMNTVTIHPERRFAFTMTLTRDEQQTG